MKNGTSSTIFYYLLLFASASHGCSIAGVFDPPNLLAVLTSLGDTGSTHNAN
jgi:hypothetical protein